MRISYTRDLFMKRTGVHSGLEKHRFRQAEEPRSPDLRKGDQAFVFVCVSIKEGYWLRLIKRFFQIVILNARLWFEFSHPSLCTPLRQGIDI